MVKKVKIEELGSRELLREILKELRKITKKLKRLG